MPPSALTLLPLLVSLCSSDLTCPSMCTCSGTNISQSRVFVFFDCRHQRLSNTMFQGKDASLGGRPILGMGEFRDAAVPTAVTRDFVVLDASYGLMGDKSLNRSMLQPLTAALLKITICCSLLTSVDKDAFAYTDGVQTLDLSDNSLMDITFITNMTSLIELNLERNRVTAISMFTVKYLTRLTTLNLRYNRLSSLTFIVHTLPALTDLNAAWNGIRYLHPQALDNKVNLTFVDVSHNQFTVISYCLMKPQIQFASLKRFTFIDNPMFCGCYLIWLLNMTAEIGHSACQMPVFWNSTNDVKLFCKDAKIPLCTSGIPEVKNYWDPYATLPSAGADHLGAEVLTVAGPHDHGDMTNVQILILAAVGCMAVAVTVVAIVKNRRLAVNKLDKSAPQEFRLSLIETSPIAGPSHRAPGVINSTNKLKAVHGEQQYETTAPRSSASVVLSQKAIKVQARSSNSAGSF